MKNFTVMRVYDDNGIHLITDIQFYPEYYGVMCTSLGGESISYKFTGNNASLEEWWNLTKDNLLKTGECEFYVDKSTCKINELGEIVEKRYAVGFSKD